MRQDPEPYPLPEIGDAIYGPDGEPTALVYSVISRDEDRVTYKQAPVLDCVVLLDE